MVRCLGQRKKVLKKNSLKLFEDQTCSEVIEYLTWLIRNAGTHLVVMLQVGAYLNAGDTEYDEGGPWKMLFEAMSCNTILDSGLIMFATNAHLTIGFFNQNTYKDFHSCCYVGLQSQLGIHLRISFIFIAIFVFVFVFVIFFVHGPGIIFSSFHRPIRQSVTVDDVIVNVAHVVVAIIIVVVA